MWWPTSPGPFDNVVLVTMPPWILLLSGSSSSGKSSLGREILGLVSAPTVLIEADTAFPAVHAWSSASALSPPIVVFHRSVAAWSHSGSNVILDGSLPYDDHVLRQRCLRELPDDRTFIVAVECSAEELRRRESSRAEPRPRRWAERQALDINDGLRLVVTVDTTDGRTADHARDVLTALDQASSR